MPAAPVPSSSSGSRKRKRGDADPEAKVQSAAVNVEKLFAKLGMEGGGEQAKKNKKGNKGQGKDKVVEHNTPQSKRATDSKSDKNAKKSHPLTSDDAPRPAQAAPVGDGAKKEKTKHKKKSAQQETKTTNAPQKSAVEEKKTSPEKGLTTLQANMKHSLDGARFR